MFYGLTKESAAAVEAAIATLSAAFARTFAADMLVTFDRNQGFLDDPDFMQAFSASAQSPTEQSLLWRLHVFCWCARNGLRRQGDFVECGVFEGFSVAVAAALLDFSQRRRRWYLYDTFAGIPPNQIGAGHVSPQAYADPALFGRVERRFEKYPNIEVIQGRVPEVLAEVAPQRIAFLHLDMNSAQAEVGALECLYERVVDGGQILLDDYGWLTYREQKAAEDLFFGRYGVPVLELPTGQGLVVK